MKKNNRSVSTNKVVAIAFLFATSILIIASGIVLGVLSFVNGISFEVLNVSVHGGVFALVICFLGVRYFLSVFKLKTEVYKTKAQFSWSNFKRVKTQK